jgi:hypothetical protein
MASGMVIELDPPRGVGLVRIGSSRAEAWRTLGNYGVVKHFSRAGKESSLVVRGQDNEVTIVAYFDSGDRVEAIEVARPAAAVKVVYAGVDLFGTCADEVVRTLSMSATVVESEGGSTYRVKALLLALWRATVPESDDDPDGRYFESVLVSAPACFEA